LTSDPLKPFPAAIVEPVLIAFAVFVQALCGWNAFDTQPALRKMVSLGPPSRLKINPDRPAWIWFYSIDAAVVLIGVIYILAAHWFSR
jgi:hypothetical protein